MMANRQRLEFHTLSVPCMYNNKNYKYSHLVNI